MPLPIFSRGNKMEALSIVVIGIIFASIVYGLVRNVMVVHMLIIANFIIFLITIVVPAVATDLAFRPSYLTEPELGRVYTVITSMFLHSTSNYLHIIANMVFLFLIGIPFEQEIGKHRFLLIYIVSGVGAVIAYTILDPGDVFLIGASGAIFGILGAFAAAYPLKRITVPIPAFILFIVKVPVVAVALLYVGLETFFTFAGYADGTAHSAHLGGFIAGVALVPLFKVHHVSRETYHETVQLSAFEPFVTTERQKELLRQAQDADEPELREAWLDTLKKDMSCPKCGGPVELSENGLQCANAKCDYNR